MVDGQTIGYTLVDADSVTAPKGVSFHGVATNCKPGPHTVEARPHLVDTAIATGQRINRPIRAVGRWGTGPEHGRVLSWLIVQ
jgi:hypothetical protein